ncbi:Endoplasmin [Trichinella pseudospiralis]|uniref:Endoplasmin n=1 Tax=Trichinella pseudospiralis TaxID=6337 RepID=A0A0V1IMN4_TRIPS|nr:Endoplasmin [Trichinella pseudospiralis]KRZ24098.1 Endoplasmin [Trichinella pseudospiralis]
MWNIPKQLWLILAVALVVAIVKCNFASANDKVKVDNDASPSVDPNPGKHKEGSRTDDETIQKEEEAIKLDGISVSQMKELRQKAEHHTFQAEVDRMMKLIINSLYKNKEIFLRELISNGSDALDKIRLLSLTDPQAMETKPELSIRIKADKENNVLHITDTGIGMTKAELISNLGTIARSGTSQFFKKFSEASPQEQQDLIGQFGVGFYSSFLVADRVVVTSKHNNDTQHIWESDAGSFNVFEDPRGNELGRGTTVTLHIKEESQNFLEPTTLEELTVDVEESAEEEEKKESPVEDEEGKVEEASQEKPKKKKETKTVWDWELVNDTKPIWLRKAADIEEKEYQEFYKSLTKDYSSALAYTHFQAEGEVSFKSILFIPERAPSDLYRESMKRNSNIKLYVRRVFISDEFEDFMPKYLSFIKGIVDSDDLPLNVSRETLQQNKLIKVIRKKLVRKVLDLLKKLPKEKFEKFWKEYSTVIKMGVFEDPGNRQRLSKLLRFQSSNHPSDLTSLAEYVERMSERQKVIYYMAGTSRKEVESSPFVERLLKKGIEVLYLVDPVDEYCMNSLPEFDNKKFQNVAKEGLSLEMSEKTKQRIADLENDFSETLKWLKEDALKDKIEKAVLSQRLTKSPCALVASAWGWSGNMERLMRSQTYSKSQDPTQEYYMKEKKVFEINPYHPVIKAIKQRVNEDKSDPLALSVARLLYDAATLRSGYLLKDSADFADRIDVMLKSALNLNPDEGAEEIEEDAEEDLPPIPKEEPIDLDTYVPHFVKDDEKTKKEEEDKKEEHNEL